MTTKIEPSVSQMKPMIASSRQFSGGKTRRASSGVWSCTTRFGEQITQTLMH